MMKKILSAIILGIVLLTSTICFAANRYFVDGGVDDNWSTSGNWSASSGGEGGETVPSSSDAVFLNANSPSCEVDTAASCASLDATGYPSGKTWALSAGLNVAGSLTMPAAGVTFNPGTQTVTISGTGNFTGNAYTFYNLTQSGAITTTQTNSIAYVTNVFTVANGGTWTGANVMALTNTTNTANPFVFTGGTLSNGGLQMRASQASLAVNVPVDGTYDLANAGSITFWALASGVTFNLTGNLTQLKSGASQNTAYIGIYGSGVGTTGKFDTNDYSLTLDNAYMTIGNSSYSLPCTYDFGNSTVTLGRLLVASNGGSQELVCGTAGITVNYSSSVSVNFANGTGTLNFTDTASTWTFAGTDGGSVDFNGETIDDITINSGIVLAGTVDINGNVVIASGETLNAAGYQMNVAGNWTKNGTFTHGNNTVVFDGTSTLAGETTFNNLTFNPGSTEHLTSTQTFTVAGTFNAQGTIGSPITLDAVTPGSRAILPVTTLGTVSYVTATDIDSSGGVTVIDTNGTLSNTVNWALTSRVGKASSITMEF